MTAKYIYLGASYPSVAVMPSPSRFESNETKRGPANESADGTLYAHQMGRKTEFTIEWDEIDSADLNTISTEYRRSRTLALVDFTGTSWTVVASFAGLRVRYIEGTNPQLFTVQVMLREK